MNENEQKVMKSTEFHLALDAIHSLLESPNARGEAQQYVQIELLFIIAEALVELVAESEAKYL